MLPLFPIALLTSVCQHPDVKFLRAVSDETIPNYPDKNLPTILVYKKGEIKCQMIGLVQLGGTEKDVTVEELDFQLGALGGTWTPPEQKPTRKFKVLLQFFHFWLFPLLLFI